MGTYDPSNLDSMDASEFQEVLTELIKRMGFTVDHTQKTWNGGIDFTAHTEEPMVAVKYIIQCRRHSTPIEEAVVRKLYELMTSGGADKGILVTNSTFSPAALFFAEGKPLELIAGTKLARLVNEHLPKNHNAGKRSLSISQETILRNLVARIEVHRTRYSDLKKGLSYEQGKHVFDFSQFFTLATKHLTEQEALLSTLESVMTSLSLVVSRSIEEMDESGVKSLLDKLDRVLTQFVDHCQIAFSLQVGEGLTTIKGYFVELDAFPLEEFWKWHNSIKAVLHDPVSYAKDGIIDLVYRIDGAKGSFLIQRYKKEADRLLKKEVEPRKERSKPAKHYSDPAKKSVPYVPPVLWKGVQSVFFFFTALAGLLLVKLFGSIGKDMNKGN